MSAPSNKGLIWTVVVLLLLVAGGIVGFRYLRPVALVETVTSSEAIDAKPGNVTVTEEYSQPVTPELAGRILPDDFNLKEGQVVKAGEVLARLDPQDLLLEKQKTQIDYDAAKATVDTKLTDQRFALENAKIAFANAKRAHEIGGMSEQDFNNAQQSLTLAEEAPKLTEILNKQNLDTLRNTLATQQRAIDKMTLKASFDGVVKEVFAHPGQLVGAGSPIATLITIQKRVIGKISDENFADIRVGQPCVVTFIPYGSFIFNGEITQILPTTDPETQRHIVYIHVRDIKPEQLVPGINGELAVTVGQHEAKTVVPRRAVFSTDVDNVYVVKDGVVHLRQVTKGYVWSKGVEILDGLQPGDQVIVESLEDFHDGDHVRPQLIPSEFSAAKSE